MAEKRMFAKTIIDSDAFLDMPLSSQALYFHLSMRADDEGFINNPKKIQRMIGASDDDLKVLIAKSFIITFDTGIIVIKHWKIHNYIRGDRVQATKYQEERNLLEVKENGAYTLCDDLCEMSATEKRKIAYKESELPYCFTYKIRRVFDGKTCPVCGCTMNSSYKLTMPTIQHNVPISKGGKHTIDNISVICESCNASIRDKETGSLNNEKVKEMWAKILVAEEQNIDWFYHPELLENIDVSQMSGRCQSSDGQVSGKCQHRLDKNRLDKNRLDKNSNICSPSEEEERATIKKADIDKVLSEWNSIDGIPKVTKLATGTKRYKMLKQRIEEYSLNDVLKAIENVRNSDFLTNKWKGFNFEWFVKPNNFPKVLEGNYNKESGNERTSRQSDEDSEYKWEDYYPDIPLS
jgi:hypothetical protein